MNELLERQTTTTDALRERHTELVATVSEVREAVEARDPVQLVIAALPHLTEEEGRALKARLAHAALAAAERTEVTHRQPDGGVVTATLGEGSGKTFAMLRARLELLGRLRRPPVRPREVRRPIVARPRARGAGRPSRRSSTSRASPSDDDPSPRHDLALAAAGARP